MLLVHSETIQRRRKNVDSLSRGSVQVGGESLYYEAMGNPEEGPTILFLHESGGTAATWQQQLLGLAAKARCLAMDLPGHGRSEGLGFATVSGFRAAVVDFLDALAIQWPVILVGTCLGAAVAVDLAVQVPGRVQGLVLSGVREGGRATAETVAAAARGEAHDEFVQQLFSPRPPHRLIYEHLTHWRLTSPLVRQGDLAAVASYNITDHLRRTNRPTLLVAGGQDPMVRTALYDSLVEQMSDACAIEIPEAGCLSMAEQPALFNRAVLGFLSGLAPVRPVSSDVRHGGYRRF